METTHKENALNESILDSVIDENSPQKWPKNSPKHADEVDSKERLKSGHFEATAKNTSCDFVPESDEEAADITDSRVNVSADSHEHDNDDAVALQQSWNSTEQNNDKNNSFNSDETTYDEEELLKSEGDETLDSDDTENDLSSDDEQQEEDESDIEVTDKRALIEEARTKIEPSAVGKRLESNAQARTSVEKYENSPKDVISARLSGTMFIEENVGNVTNRENVKTKEVATRSNEGDYLLSAIPNKDQSPLHTTETNHDSKANLSNLECDESSKAIEATTKTKVSANETDTCNESEITKSERQTAQQTVSDNLRLLYKFDIDDSSSDGGEDQDNESSENVDTSMEVGEEEEEEKMVVDMPKKRETTVEFSKHSSAQATSQTYKSKYDLSNDRSDLHKEEIAHANISNLAAEPARLNGDHKHELDELSPVQKIPQTDDNSNEFGHAELLQKPQEEQQQKLQLQQQQEHEEQHDVDEQNTSLSTTYNESDDSLKIADEAESDHPTTTESFNKPVQPVSPAIVDVSYDDNASNCSSLGSSESSATTASSIRDLVIDHPNEELEVQKNVSPVENAPAERKFVMPLKLSLKRRWSRSNSNDFDINYTSEAKQPHLDADVGDSAREKQPEIAEIAETVAKHKDSSIAAYESKEQFLTAESVEKSESTRYMDAESVEAVLSASSAALFPTPVATLSPPPPQQPLVPALSHLVQQNNKTQARKLKSNNFVGTETLNEHWSSNSMNLKSMPTHTATSLPAIKSITTETANDRIAPKSISKQLFYKCTTCCTYHEQWNLFQHLRDIHNRHMCFYCLRLFPTVEKLSLHLEIKHDLEQNHYNTEQQLRETAQLSAQNCVIEKRFLMCCSCQHSFNENEPFSDHICSKYIIPCSMCGLKGRHTNQCAAQSNAKRSSTSKKKTKQQKVSFTTTKNAIQSFTFPLPPTACFENLHCDRNQKQQDLSLHAAMPALHNNESNDSSSMVIDDSCTNNHGNSLFNPFKALDERERLEQQLSSISADAALPPDRGATQIVPKLKLRVPKEFQKSVDAAISTSESDEDEDELNGGGGVMRNELSNVEPTLNAALPLQFDTAKADKTLLQDASAEQSRNSAPIEDEDSNESNPMMRQLLQEIERTKMDIQLTKQTKQKYPSITEQQSNNNETAAHNWSHTPPASPNAQQKNDTCRQQEAERLQQLAARSLSSRRDTIGSDAMDIDETLTERQTQSIAGNETLKMIEQFDAFKDFIAHKIEMQEVNETAPNENLALVDQSKSVGGLETKGTTPKTLDILPSDKEEDEVDVCAHTPVQQPLPPADGIEVANEDTVCVDLQLDRPLDKFEIVDFVRICLKAVYPICLYCNHARRIAVNGHSLVLHMIAQHRFTATVDSITAEELQTETIVAKLKSFLPALEHEFLNSNSYCSRSYATEFNERIFECFQCRFVTVTHKELYLHNRKMHLKTAILCFMCRANFFSFSEILCHKCPGAPYKTPVFDVKFHCCLCNQDDIPSPFRLMVHLRKRHFACDVCLEDCRDQSRLSSHVWKHKLHHLCYRCGIAYRNKMDITKHLFWKHGTESVICKRCLQKRWPHVYHFCVPPITFVCDVCHLSFSKATYLNVHKRIHIGDYRYPCSEEHCEEKFISRPMLLKHTADIHPQPAALPCKAETEENADKKNNDFASQGKQVTTEEEAADSGEKTRTTELKKETQIVKTEAPAKSVIKEESTTETQKDATLGANRKRKKKSKRTKESLEDLNLTAPNLSESDSCDGSDGDGDSKSKFDDEELLVPNVMLSPPSEAENENENEAGKVLQKENKTDESVAATNGGKVLEIWQNLLQGQQPELLKIKPTEANYTEDNYPTPKKLHVASSDHDYCVMVPPKSKSSPLKRKSGKSPRRHASNRNLDASSSSSDGSSSSSDSSCSCGSNCSCSSSGSGSSSSSSSSSDSSRASNASRKQRHRKKSERDHNRKKSESISPLKKHNNADIVNVVDVDVNEQAPLPSSSPPKPLFSESELATAESSTDEEFYDEHPQKLASELLALKRAQLMAQTRLSPSHNYDIVENSRPSTPSLPEDVARGERKMKLKKKKRDRKSSGRSNLAATTSLNYDIGKAPALNVDGLNASAYTHALLQPANNLVQSYANMNSVQNYYEHMQASPNVAEPPAAYQPTTHDQTSSLLRTAVMQNLPARMSSCSDEDGSLKRSKRARRPNKFYGYTSDDENSIQQQPLMIGSLAIKPQPPPQLTWRKEDLPTPSRSILNNKIKAPRTTKATSSAATGGLFDANVSDGGSGFSTPSTITKKKRQRINRNGGITRKRTTKKPKNPNPNPVPRIPTLKIRPSQIDLNASTMFDGGTNHIPASQIYSSSKDTDDSSYDDEDEDMSEDPSAGQLSQGLVANVWNSALQLPIAAPATVMTPKEQALFLPAPQVQQPRELERKIPAAFMPNPDFAAIQYFKANNIRYPIRPPAGARQARDGESVYCYCRCPYDEVSEMIACDGSDCLIEWFHFECVGIMVAPQGKWFCPECRPKYSEELYPTSIAK